MKALKLAGLFAVLLLPLASHAKSEDDYNKEWCATIDGAVEYHLLDRTRVDCITDTHAWEMDYARKWYEGVGQALHYSRLTGLKAGLALIVRTDRDYRYVVAALRAIAHYKLPIELEVVR